MAVVLHARDNYHPAEAFVICFKNPGIRGFDMCFEQTLGMKVFVHVY